ncbi:MAG: InlB B-repeat-containing protein [Oscillospiraceae bacterium]|nr:InlB B-repeat-containing protein [Oscillospiraceae bacterium]
MAFKKLLSLLLLLSMLFSMLPYAAFASDEAGEPMDTEIIEVEEEPESDPGEGKDDAAGDDLTPGDNTSPAPQDEGKNEVIPVQPSVVDPAEEPSSGDEKDPGKDSDDGGEGSDGSPKDSDGNQDTEGKPPVFTVSGGDDPSDDDGKTVVAIVDGTEYTSLQEAFSAAGARNTTVYLHDFAEEDVTVGKGDSLTFHLNDGAYFGEIINCGRLTVTGTGAFAGTLRTRSYEVRDGEGNLTEDVAYAATVIDGQNGETQFAANFLVEQVSEHPVTEGPLPALTITGGDFMASVLAVGKFSEEDSSFSGDEISGRIEVSGGCFAEMPERFLASGYAFYPEEGCYVKPKRADAPVNAENDQNRTQETQARSDGSMPPVFEGGNGVQDSGNTGDRLTQDNTPPATPTFAVTYELYGDVLRSNTVEEGTQITLPNESREGYRFAGWQNGEDVYAPGDPFTVTEDTAFTAVWEINEYTITYMLNGGEGEESDTYTVEDAVTFPVPSREGATFGGWYYAGDFSGEAVTGLPAGTARPVILYARWLCTLTYEADSSSSSVGQVKIHDEALLRGGRITVPLGEDVELTFVPVGKDVALTEFILNGKAVDPLPEESYTIPSVSEDITVKAIFDTQPAEEQTKLASARKTALSAAPTEPDEKPDDAEEKWTVIFKTDEEHTETLTADKENDEVVVPAPASVPEGKVFTGWKNDAKTEKEEDDTLLQPEDTLEVSGDASYTAVFEDKAVEEPALLTGNRLNAPASPGTGEENTAVLYYDATLGKVKFGEEEIANGGFVTIPEGATITISFEPVAGNTVNECTVDGVKKGSINTLKLSRTGKKQVVYVMFSGTTFYTLTYSYNVADPVDNSANPTGFSETHGEILLNDASKEGYQFTGWYKDAEHTEVTDKIEKIPADSVNIKSLYGKFSPVEYAITYHLDGGTNHPDNKNKYTVEETVTLYDASKSGFVFAGWYEDSAFEKPVSSIPAGSTGNKEFWAKFLQIYTIKYVVDGVEDTSLTPKEYIKTDGVITLPTVSRPAKVFKGWKDETGTSVTTINAEEERNRELKTDLINRYTVTYVLDGGINPSSNPTSYTDDDVNPIPLAVAARTGYTFMGWFTEAAHTNQVTAIDPLKKQNITLYAAWEKIPELYKVYIYYNTFGSVQAGGSVVPSGTYVPVQEGKSINLYFNPIDSKYYVYNCTLNGEKKGSISALTISNIQSDQRVVVSFMPTITRPMTGDDSNLALWIALMAASAAAVAGVLITRKKRKK